MSPQLDERTTDQADAPRQPSGRDEIMSAVLDAATEMLAEHSPSVLTVRQIAKRAGVPHSVVHRYFGTKDDLIRAVVVQRGQQELTYDPQLGTVTPDEQLRKSLETNSAYFRTYLRMALDGIDPYAETEGAPALRSLLEWVEQRGPQPGAPAPEVDPRVAVALVVAATMGWSAMSSVALKALGYPEEQASDALEQVSDVLAYVLGLNPPPA